ncbi:MAG: transcriptional regulator, PadR-like family [Ramlibacter sp.]|nr:transcriptional regulator, PadR-like family [Ramlibacter sp.]
MSLRFALLGFIGTTPASGYTLGRKFADGAGAMWEALPSQIYPELRRLEQMGWITGDVDGSDLLRRRVYHLTDSGRQALTEWVEAEEAEHPPERNVELVRFLFLDRSDFGVIQRHALRHRAHYVDRLAKWRSERDDIANGKHERMTDRLRATPTRERGFVTGMKWFAFDGLVRRAEMEIEWADSVLCWLEGLQGSKKDSCLPTRNSRSPVIPESAPKGRTVQPSKETR